MKKLLNITSKVIMLLFMRHVTYRFKFDIFFENAIRKNAIFTKKLSFIIENLMEKICNQQLERRLNNIFEEIHFFIFLSAILVFWYLEFLKSEIGSDRIRVVISNSKNL